VLRMLSIRARMLLAAAVAALPLVGLVAYAAVDRYTADHARATRSASNRAVLFASLLAADKDPSPSAARVGQLLRLSPLPAGSALVIFDQQGRVVARAGPTAAGPLTGARPAAALARRAGTFEATGADGVERVWGLRAIDGGRSTVAFGLPGAGVYGPARTALQRDLGLAAAAALLAFLAAFVLTGRATAPLRRLASRVAGNGGGAGDIGTIERGFAELDEAVEQGVVELARRAERLAALRSIDRAILAAETPSDIAQAALVRLRALVGAVRAEVVLFDRDGRRADPLAIATVAADGTGEPFSGVFEHDGELLNLDMLRLGRACVCADLALVASSSELARFLHGHGVRSHAAVAMIGDGELLGAVALGFCEPGAVGDDALAAAGEVADQFAIALRHAQLHEELQAVIDAAIEGIIVIDDERRLVAANEPAGRIFGRPRDELIGLRVGDLVASSPGEVTLERVLAEGSAQGMVSSVLVGGERRELEVRGRADFRPGRHLFAMLDLTQRVRLEDQLRQAQKMEAIGQLAGGVAHDFNNLLTAISGYGDMASRRVGAGPGAMELAEIVRAAERAAQLTRQLLAFSRQQILEPVAVDLNEATTALMPMLTRLIGEDIEIVVFPADQLATVLADRAQIEQVIINLALNARDAMPTGGTLTIETRTIALSDGYADEHANVEPGDYVCLTVTDTGGGIEPGALEHIFEPFYTTKDVGHGTGLGLATVHGIVTQSRGHVRVYSEPGLGTAFKVYLPASTSATIIADAKGPQQPERLAGTETVLLCEDETIVRRLIERILTEDGYSVIAAATPRDALKLVAEHPDAIDILVSDIVMPDISGPDLAARLQTLKPGLQTLFLSGYTAEVAHRRGNLPKGSAFLEKPFQRTALLHAIRDLLDHPNPPSTLAPSGARHPAAPDGPSG
jgi:two-component system cell cycle sensor histidine kinase/response regulator CckA